MTPEPTPCTRCGCCCCICGKRSPKKSRSDGSSMKGNCCAFRARSVDLMVTTAGAPRLTRSAYEFCTLAVLATGAVAADWPLMAPKEKTTRTKLKNKFVRETAPLYIFMSFIPKISAWWIHKIRIYDSNKPGSVYRHQISDKSSRGFTRMNADQRLSAARCAGFV